jgi:hypothetical protein
MKYEFDKVIDGASRYINDVMYPGMNQAQEFAARVMVGRVLANSGNIKTMLTSNGFIRTFGVMDSAGMIEVESLFSDIKREIARQGNVTFEIPLFGKYTFVPEDVDALYKYIAGEGEKKHESD